MNDYRIGRDITEIFQRLRALEERIGISRPEVRREQETYSASAKFAVRWNSDGGLSVIDAPTMRGQNPYLVCADGQVIASLISGADRITDEFFAQVGKVYQRQFMALSEEEKRRVEFPIVEFEVPVTGLLDRSNLQWISLTARLFGRYIDLSGSQSTLNLERTYYRVPAEPHPLVFYPDEGNEIEGHPDPNCIFSWTGCQCTNRCCDHIVRSIFTGKCYDEYCGWGWLWLACGCHRNKVVPCP